MVAARNVEMARGKSPHRFLLELIVGNFVRHVPAFFLLQTSSLSFLARNYLTSGR